MARIEISGVRHSYLRAPQSDGDYALRRIDHAWETGIAREWRQDLADSRQDIYSLDDGEPVDDAG